MCPNPPTPPTGGLVQVLHGGSKFGPQCPPLVEPSSPKCPGVKLKIEAEDYERTIFSLDIITTNQGIDKLYLLVNVSNAPDSFQVRVSGVCLDKLVLLRISFSIIKSFEFIKVLGTFPGLKKGSQN